MPGVSPAETVLFAAWKGAVTADNAEDGFAHIRALTGSAKSTNNAATNAAPKRTNPLDILNDLTQPRSQPAKPAPKK